MIEVVDNAAPFDEVGGIVERFNSDRGGWDGEK
jgi:hypothetical protein